MQQKDYRNVLASVNLEATGTKHYEISACWGKAGFTNVGLCIKPTPTSDDKEYWDNDEYLQNELMSVVLAYVAGNYPHYAFKNQKLESFIPGFNDVKKGIPVEDMELVYDLLFAATDLGMFINTKQYEKTDSSTAQQKRRIDQGEKNCQS